MVLSTFHWHRVWRQSAQICMNTRKRNKWILGEWSKNTNTTTNSTVGQRERRYPEGLCYGSFGASSASYPTDPGLILATRVGFYGVQCSTVTGYVYRVLRYSPVSTTSSPVPVAARSKAWVYGRSPVDIVGSNPTGGMDVRLLWVFCQLEISATDWSLVQKSPTDCGASLCVI